jgi:hypothetical protein
LRKFGISMWEASFQIAIRQAVDIRPQSQCGVFGWLSVPCRDGVLHDFTSTEEMKRIPQVLDVDIHYQPGDRVLQKQGSDYELAKATIYYSISWKYLIMKKITLSDEQYK